VGGGGAGGPDVLKEGTTEVLGASSVLALFSKSEPLVVFRGIELGMSEPKNRQHERSLECKKTESKSGKKSECPGLDHTF